MFQVITALVEDGTAATLEMVNPVVAAALKAAMMLEVFELVVQLVVVVKADCALETTL